MVTMSDYTSVQVPKFLTKKIKKLFVESKEYRSVSEFVIESTRVRIEKLESRHQDASMANTEQLVTANE